MWSAFRELDRKIRSLSEEEVANSAADRVEHRVISLRKQLIYY